MNKNKSQLMLY